ncbi:MAG: type II secretion system F family protein [Gammaproteobacteria bacterium]
MSLDLILLILSASLTLGTVMTMIVRRRPSRSNDFSTSNDSVYANLSGLSRMLRVLSINAHPILCLALLTMLSFSVALGLVEFFLLPTLWIPIIGLGLIGICLYIAYEMSMHRRRRFEAKLPEAIEIMQAASVAGATPQAAIQSVVEYSTKNVKSEFQVLLIALQYGAPIESATARISALYDSEGTRMLMQVLIATWNMGGRLDVLLTSVSKMVRERLSMRLKVAGKLSGAKLSAIFMALAPYALIPFFISNQPQWLQIFLDHPYGLKAIGMAVGLQLIGAIWLRKILKVAL